MKTETKAETKTEMKSEMKTEQIKNKIENENKNDENKNENKENESFSLNEQEDLEDEDDDELTERTELDEFKSSLSIGITLFKHDRAGNTRLRTIFSSDLCKTLLWREPPSETSIIRRASNKIFQKDGLNLKELIEVRLGIDMDPSAPGKTGTIFLRTQGADLTKSFSLIFLTRSLDCTCDSDSQFKFVTSGFKLLLGEQNK